MARKRGSSDHSAATVVHSAWPCLLDCPRAKGVTSLQSWDRGLLKFDSVLSEGAVCSKGTGNVWGGKYLAECRQKENLSELCLIRDKIRLTCGKSTGDCLCCVSLWKWGWRRNGIKRILACLPTTCTGCSGVRASLHLWWIVTFYPFCKVHFMSMPSMPLCLS